MFNNKSIWGYLLAPVIFATCWLGSTPQLKATTRHSAKIDTAGQYLRFPGITVISMATEQLLAQLHDLELQLRKIPGLQNYYTFLPTESYHLTVTNLYTQSGLTDDQWKAFLDQRSAWFASLEYELTAHPILPKGSFSELKYGSTLTLVVKLRSESWNEISKLTEETKAPYSDDYLKSFGPQEFHVTLAYQYGNPPKSTSDEMRNQLRTLFEAFKRKVPEANFEQAGLYTFDSMTAYEPFRTAQGDSSGTPSPKSRPTCIFRSDKASSSSKTE